MHVQLPLQAVEDPLTMPYKLAIGQGAATRALSVLTREGDQPAVVWLPGFRPALRSIKGAALHR